MEYENLSESLKELSRGYPLPQRTLKYIIDNLKEVYDESVLRINQNQRTLTARERFNIDNFLFYYKKLQEHNVSPIGIAVRGNRTGYGTDFSIPFSSFAWINLVGDKFPKYYGNNFWTLFSIKSSLNEEEPDSTSNPTLEGDSLFNYRKNPLKYVNWQGKEIDTGKTPLEAWNEFKRENPELIRELIKICNQPSDKRSEMWGEIERLTGRAFTFIRVKGFDEYPLNP